MQSTNDQYFNNNNNNNINQFINKFHDLNSQLFQSLKFLHKSLNSIWNNQSIWKKFIILIFGLILIIFLILAIIYHQSLLNYIVNYSDKWKENNFKLTTTILILLLFIVSFPPLIGFSFLSTVTGIIFGVTLHGWLILIVGSIIGATLSFLLFRYVLKSQAQYIISSNEKLFAFSTILKDDNSFWILAMIRLCPTPYSLTNGALGSIPGISVWNFFLANLISSPKLLLYLFVGTKLKHIGEDSSNKEKIVDILSIILTIILIGITGYVLYFKTTKRLLELESNTSISNLIEFNQDSQDFNDDEFQFELDQNKKTQSTKLQTTTNEEFV
ncbi:hypothetical protein WICMUC_003353 [Wickerhamomyces mucosus]|uniref:Golgi apparatus membrane protein TVP38 n=1 Tax=Wickerhamomyces mucosus TaxID=1378264 RepID=A0A9P8TCG0_9ASCO|nr:hypothetical protein WICMUC_003353 [Wickerhamomyces mucosus]